MVPHILHEGKNAEVDVTLGRGGRGETKEHVLEKHTYPPTERAFLPTEQTVGAPHKQPLDTSLL